MDAEAGATVKDIRALRRVEAKQRELQHDLADRIRRAREMLGRHPISIGNIAEWGDLTPELLASMQREAAERKRAARACLDRYWEQTARLSRLAPTPNP